MQKRIANVREQFAHFSPSYYEGSSVADCVIRHGDLKASGHLERLNLARTEDLYPRDFLDHLRTGKWLLLA